MTHLQPDGEAALEGMLSNCTWRPQSSPLGTWCGDAETLDR